MICNSRDKNLISLLKMKSPPMKPRWKHHSSLIFGFLCCCSVVSDSLKPYGLLCLWDSPSKNTRRDWHFLLQGIFPASPALQVYSLHWNTWEGLLNPLEASNGARLQKFETSDLILVAAFGRAIFPNIFQGRQTSHWNFATHWYRHYWW